MLAEYEQRAALTPVNPARPPVAHKIDLPSAPELRPGPGPGLEPLPNDGLPSLPAGLPGAPFAGTPEVPAASELTDAVQNSKGSTGSAKVGPGIRPASVGGFGNGIPKLPLVLADSVSRAGGAAPGGASLAGGIPVPPAYAALNNGGGTGMPMSAAPGGPGQEAGKGKRVQQQDRALYTEDRAWTEGVIGRRRAS